MTAVGSIGNGPMTWMKKNENVLRHYGKKIGTKVWKAMVGSMTKQSIGSTDLSYLRTKIQRKNFIMKNDGFKAYTWCLNETITNEAWAWSQMFSENECKLIIELGKKLPLEDSRIGKNDTQIVDHSVRNSKVGFFHINDETTWIFQRVTQAVNKTNNDYFQYDLQDIETIQFSEYSDQCKGFYDKHIDMMTKSFRLRKLSLTVQLSDPETYEGGDLVIHQSAHPMYTTKAQGLGIFFPSWSLHEVTPVTKGIRYSLVSWIVGPKFK
ncbi:hypothetical protein EB118_20410 [bacterium]|nr:hypothetical protein [bacterium]